MKESVSESEALLKIVGFAREDVKEGRVISSGAFKERLAKLKTEAKNKEV